MILFSDIIQYLPYIIVIRDPTFIRVAPNNRQKKEEGKRLSEVNYNLFASHNWCNGLEQPFS